MKKKILRTICFILSVSSSIAMLTACDKKQKDDYLLWYTLGDAPADNDVVVEKMNEIVKEKIGIGIKLEYIDRASYAEKMKLKMASGESYDIAFTGFANNYQTAVSMGGLYDITELCREVGMTDVIPQFYLDAATVDGKIYGIPNIQVISNPISLNVDKEVVESSGIDMNKIEEISKSAKTYEDIEKFTTVMDEAFAKVKATNPDLVTYNPTYILTTVPFYEDVMNGILVRKDGTSNKLVCDIDTEEFKLHVNKTREWYKKGYIRNDIASKGTASTVDDLKLVGIRPTTWKPGQEELSSKSYGKEQVFARLTEPYVSRESALATMNSVGANSKHPKEAVKFIKLINSDKELYNLLCFGIKDKHYTQDADGFVKEIPDSGYNGVGLNAWRYGNQFNSYLMEGQEKDVWELTEKMNNEAIKSPMLGFVPDTTNISAELANISNTRAEYTAKVMYGTADPEEWMQEYIQKLEESGIRKVQEELQKQYDEFLKNK